MNFRQLFTLHTGHCDVTIKMLRTELDVLYNKLKLMKSENEDLVKQVQEEKAMFHYQTIQLENNIKELESKAKPSNLSNKIYYWKNKYDELRKKKSFDIKTKTTQRINDLLGIINDRETELYNTRYALQARDSSYEQMRKDYERLVTSLKEQIDNLQKNTQQISGVN